MLKIFLTYAKIVFGFMLLLLNTFFWVPILLLFSFTKLLIPIKSVRLLIDPILIFIAECWIFINSKWMNLIQNITWDVEGVDGVDKNSWYLINCNHQSWADIFILQHIFNRRIPLLKFFLKQQLVWIPIIGMAWWALDFPFMKRHSEEFLMNNPNERLKDLETTRRACEKFALIPTSVMNFLEGTRFTKEKHSDQKSPFKNLLKPKVGGIALALNILGNKFKAILDVTIVYPGGVPTFWKFLSGELGHVIVRVKTLEVPTHLLKGDYATDPAVREAYSKWVNELWLKKDEQISELLGR